MRFNHSPHSAPARFLRLGFAVLVAAICLQSSLATAGHRLLTQGKGKLAVISAEGKVEWEMNWGGMHDMHVMPNGHFLVQQGPKIVEIDPAQKEAVWSYDCATSNGNAGKPVEVHAFQSLGDGKVMIAETGVGRIIEVDRDGKLLKEFKLKIDHPHPHTDTRLARKLSNGNYLVCHEGDGVVREYSSEGQVIWEFPVPLFGQEPKGGHGPEAFGNKSFGAVRLKNGHTLIGTGNGHSIIEVTPEKEIVWKLAQHDLKGITLAWVTTLEVLPNGHYVFGNCHAGAGQPQLIELDPATKQVVWTFDQFEAFGNDMSNSQLLDVPNGTLR